MKKPNIILIILDAVRAKNLSIYGYPNKTTPYLKNILNNFVLYKNNISSSYWTLPSIASLFTGTFTSKHFLLRNGDVLKSNFMTLAEFLKKNGYLTIGLSPNPFVSGYSGLNRGFDVFQDFYDQSIKQNIYDIFKHSFDNKLNSLQDTKIYKRFLWLLTSSFDKFAENTNQFIFNVLKKINNQKRPFFIYALYNEAHTPYVLPKYYKNYFLDKTLYKNPWKVNQDHIKYYSKKIKMNNKDFKILESIYNGAIKYLDKKIYELYNYLDSNDMLDNTMIIITSDHGDQFGEKNLYFHTFSLYDNLIKVPLLIKYPSNMNKTGIETNMVQNIDIYPTIVDLLGISNDTLLNQFQGNSLISDRIINREKSYAISELLKPFGPDLEPYRHKLKKFDRKLISIHSKKYKYIYSSNGLNEFYDIKNDPMEMQNIINFNNKEKNRLLTDLQPYLENYKKFIKLSEITFKLRHITRARQKIS